MRTRTASTVDRPVRLPQDRLRPRRRLDVLIRKLDRAVNRGRVALVA